MIKTIWPSTSNLASDQTQYTMLANIIKRTPNTNNNKPYLSLKRCRFDTHKRSEKKNPRLKKPYL